MRTLAVTKAVAPKLCMLTLAGPLGALLFRRRPLLRRFLRWRLWLPSGHIVLAILLRIAELIMAAPGSLPALSVAHGAGC